MIDPKYAANCLKRGFQRYIRYSKINASIDSEPHRFSTIACLQVSSLLKYIVMAIRLSNCEKSIIFFCYFTE